MQSTYPVVMRVLDDFGMDPAVGLSDERVAEQRRKYGANVIDLPTPDPWWQNLLEKFKENPIPILIGAALISIVLSLLQQHFPVEGLAILAAVVLATGVGFINEYKSNIEYEQLKLSRLEVDVTVTRNGREQVIPIADLVVGDIIHLYTGSKIPADSQLINGSALEVNESRLTGEAVAATKDLHDTVLYGGTDVEAGTGLAIVVKVGNDSKWGEIARQLVGEEQEKTPLEERLDSLTELINLRGTQAAVLIFLALLLGLIVHLWIGPAPTDVNGQPIGLGFSQELVLFVFSELVRFVIIAVTIVVVAVPEGLPMAVNVSLAFSMRKIAKDNNLVRKLIACETIGSATVICTDKTGTLTENKLTVVQMLLDGKRLSGAALNKLQSHRLFHLLQLSTVVNNQANLVEKEGKIVPDGNGMDGALLQWINPQIGDYKKLRSTVSVDQTIPFNSGTKRMITILRDNGRLLMLVKGAPERVLQLCTNIEVDGGTRPIESYRSMLDQEINQMTGEAMRMLALAYKWLPDNNLPTTDPAHDLTLLGLIGINDPIRKDVPDAINVARRAGIDVKMITGDHLQTATVVARHLGMLEADSVVMEGDVFRSLSDTDVTGLLPRLRVLARAEPLDKLRLVKLLQEKREVVAVTGDGTNDAPALKRADVGLSMGLSGTEVAKEASDIVLLDDNFRSIVRAVNWGRALYQNIQKFLQFQLTINVSALAVAFLSPLLNIILEPLSGGTLRLESVPLTVTQLLWVNLIMDTLAVLALCLEPPSPDIMQRRPIGRSENPITRIMWENILIMGGYFTLILLLLQATNFLGADRTTGREFASVLFTTFVFFQVFNEFNCRSLDPGRSPFADLFSSRNFLAVMALIVVVQVLLTQFGGEVFNTAPLDIVMWIKIIVLTSTALLLMQGIQFLRRRLSAQPANPVLNPRSAS